MLLGNKRQHHTTLARGAAVLVIGALGAGCSSGISGLTDGLTTGSTEPAMVAQADQPYPNEDAGLRSRPAYERIVRPKRAVGSALDNAPVALPAPANSAPVYIAPAESTTVTSAPLPAPSNGRSQASEPVSTAAAEVAPASRMPAAQRVPQATGASYTVVAGDTLYGISRKTGAGVEEIRRANGLSDGMIRTGQRLTIPGAGVVAASAPAETSQPVRTSNAPTPSRKPATVASREPETPKVAAYTPPVEQRKPAEEAVSAMKESVKAEETAETQVAALPPQSTGVNRLRWPVRGRVIAGFGASLGSRANDGIDIAVPEGTSVHAAENGVVIYAGDGLKGFGNTVLVRHEGGLVTVYGHTSKMNVKRGDTVRRGQEIAVSGMSGDADLPKLHFEVRKGTSPVDPMTYLE